MWPGDEDALNEDFKHNLEEPQFQKIDKWKLPESYFMDKNVVIHYKRVGSYLRAWDVNVWSRN